MVVDELLKDLVEILSISIHQGKFVILKVNESLVESKFGVKIKFKPKLKVA